MIRVAIGVLRLCCLVSATYIDCTLSELRGVLEHPEHPPGYATVVGDYHVQRLK